MVSLTVITYEGKQLMYKPVVVLPIDGVACDGCGQSIRRIGWQTGLETPVCGDCLLLMLEGTVLIEEDARLGEPIFALVGNNIVKVGRRSPSTP